MCDPTICQTRTIRGRAQNINLTMLICQFFSLVEGGVHYNGIAKDQKMSNITGGGKKIPILDTKGKRDNVGMGF